jgi:hypothetical protein
MQTELIVFHHTGLTVRAARRDEAWQGQIIDALGEVQDEFSYTRESFPGAVIGALRFRELDFAVRLAPRLWLLTESSLSVAPEAVASS